MYDFWKFVGVIVGGFFEVCGRLMGVWVVVVNFFLGWAWQIFLVVKWAKQTFFGSIDRY